MDVCLLAGRIMLQNGAETYRVEDTMIRMAKAANVTAHSFVTPTGIIFSVEGEMTTRLVRVTERAIDLQKVTEANDVSRAFCNHSISIDEASLRLQTIDRSRHAYNFLIQVLAAGVSSGCFLIMFQGPWVDFLPACVCGGLGFSCSLYFQRFMRIKFVAEFLASFIVGLISLLFSSVGIGRAQDVIIIASLMPLVPGLLITNAIRDLIAGHLVAGTSKGIEALLTALAIGGGIATTLAIL